MGISQVARMASRIVANYGDDVLLKTKIAPKGCLKFNGGEMKNVPTAFKKLTDPQIGTELQHGGTGIRIFQSSEKPLVSSEWAQDVNGALFKKTTVMHPTPGATVILPNGKYSGITSEEFKTLSNMAEDELNNSPIWQKILDWFN